jgi:glucan phosphorylase
MEIALEAALPTYSGGLGVLAGDTIRAAADCSCTRLEICGSGGERCVVPVYFLDTDVPENSEWDRGLTRSLYGGDWYMRLCQEVVLGVREYRCSVHSVTTKSSGFT